MPIFARKKLKENEEISAEPIPKEEEEVVIEKISEKDEAKAPEAQLAVNVYRLPGELVIVAPIAGIEKKNLLVKINQDVLLIEGQRDFAEEKLSAPEDVLVKECFAGHFSRTIVLPEDLNVLKTKASFKHNVLKITIPRLGKTAAKIVKVEIE